MPEDSGLAFVVVLHLSPEHESFFSGFAAERDTDARVQVSEAGKGEANCVSTRISTLVRTRPVHGDEGRRKIRINIRASEYIPDCVWLIPSVFPCLEEHLVPPRPSRQIRLSRAPS
jgi:hypothetical protein